MFRRDALATIPSIAEIDFPLSFGEWLKCRRKELDLTQVELAQRAGCSLPALRKIEAGERRPSKQLAGLLAQSLEIPLEDQTSFIRVARGELNIERLRSPMSARATAYSIDQKPYTSLFNLPVQPTPLFGRETELAALGKLLVDPNCHLLTIIGMGGIGKTRLAVELASMQKAYFPGGVYYVPLASINSPDFIAPAIADVFGLTFSGTLDSQEQLLNLLKVRAGQALLLVLDNLEHLLVLSDPMDIKVDATMLLNEFIQRLPNLKILVTSRERICIHGEWTFELNGLPFPTVDVSGRLESFSAIALFLQRARQAKPDFEVLLDEQLSLARVCQLVEGTPLAIELAAAWVGMLSIDEIAQEIAANLDFLTSTKRDIPERHRSLRATFEHSWKLLSVEEQQGLCRLAVFRGGFQREAAEQVAGASLSILKSLFSKSLLLRRENGRYDLHEVIRQYALSHLTDDTQNEATNDRHCEFYRMLVQDQEKALVGAAQSNAIQVLGKELGNLRAAMEWGLGNSQVQRSLQIATGLGQFWITQGYWREGLEWLEQGLGGPEPLADVVRAKALTMAGWLSRYLGDYPNAITMLQESLVLWRRTNDLTGLALTLCNLGASVLHQGDAARATALLEEAASLSQQHGYLFGRYLSLENLGHAASRQGNSQRTIEFYNEALALARGANDENEIMKLMASIGDENIILGDYDQAEDWFSLAMPICHRLGSSFVSAFITAHRGVIAMKKGDYPRAFDMLAESMLVSQELGDKEEAISSFESMALIGKEMGFPDRAVRLLAASESQHQLIDVIRSQPQQADYDLYVAVASSQLGEAEFEAAWAEGSAMTYEQALAYAVDKSWQTPRL